MVRKTLYMNQLYCPGFQYLCPPGWGFNGAVASNTLQSAQVSCLVGSISVDLYLQVPIVSDDVCQEAMTSLTIEESMLCAGGKKAGSCKVCPVSCPSC